MAQPPEKPVAFRFKRPEVKAQFEAYMSANGVNANQAANQLIEQALAPPRTVPPQPMKPAPRVENNIPTSRVVRQTYSSAPRQMTANEQAAELAKRSAEADARWRILKPDTKGKK